MGSDNLAQFDRWKDWRGIARIMPIAVIARPGYDRAVVASPAMAWLRRYRKPAASIRNRAEWGAPALVLLRFDPDPRSATAIRQTDPRWASRLSIRGLRDGVTFHPIPSDAG
jgi:nicotinate-nucleotide adenylyltransferase